MRTTDTDLSIESLRYRPAGVLRRAKPTNYKCCLENEGESTGQLKKVAEMGPSGLLARKGSTERNRMLSNDG